MKISEIDKNLALDIVTSDENTVFMDVSKEPFQVTGVLLPTEQEPYYRRMPQELADRVSKGVSELNHHTAGGRVRFRTDSPYISLHSVQSAVCLMNHMAVCGIGGFDLYAKADGEDEDPQEYYVGTFRPPFQLETGYDAIVRLPDRRMRTFTLNMPLYGGVNELYLGFDRESVIEAPPAQRYKPVAYYGSSITQGGCASRPGNSYQGILSRALDCGQVNLGFSGNGMGEPEVAEYIAAMDLSAFVMDLDNNCHSPEQLRSVHDPFFQIIRKAQPKLPVIFVSRPPLMGSDQNPARIEVILETYNKALAAGDKHVYFVNGSEFFDAFAGDCATVDGCHPNDYGFVLMALGILPTLEKALKEAE